VQLERALDRTWIYIDMDMFFAAVEIKDNPELKCKPVIVYDNAMIMTASYQAREFGIKSGMPLFIGKKLCKDAVLIKANYSRYRMLSQQFKDTLAKYDEDYESQGLDEASIDATSFLRTNGMDTIEGRIFLATKIRKEIFDAVQLTASCGIACNRLLAKICSGIKKPNGLTYLDFNQQEILNFMKDMPITKL
jgi:DNA polymerase kappa